MSECVCTAGASSSSATSLPSSSSSPNPVAFFWFSISLLYWLYWLYWYKVQILTQKLEAQACSCWGFLSLSAGGCALKHVRVEPKHLRVEVKHLPVDLWTPLPLNPFQPKYPPGSAPRAVSNVQAKDVEAVLDENVQVRVGRLGGKYTDPTDPT